MCVSVVTPMYSFLSICIFIYTLGDGVQLLYHPSYLIFQASLSSSYLTLFSCLFRSVDVLCSYRQISVTINIKQLTISNIVIRITKEETDIAYTCDQGPKERHTHTHTDTQYRRCVCIYAYEKQGEREKQRITKKF
jgi:hypothetical protein